MSKHLIYFRDGTNELVYNLDFADDFVVFDSQEGYMKIVKFKDVKRIESVKDDDAPFEVPTDEMITIKV